MRQNTQHHNPDKDPAVVSTKPSESMACVGCRSRKLKCSRDLPSCVRCSRIKIECVYPESRRKPLNKRRNVKELEARLSLVEGLLKDVTKPKQDESTVSSAHNSSTDISPHDFSPESGSGGDVDWPSDNPAPPTFTGYGAAANDEPAPPVDDDGFFSSELMGLGMFEAPPPFEAIEELHTGYFQCNYYHIPIIHPARYLKAFHSAPHMRPPMCLQYAVWATAAKDMDKYSTYHSAFYRRARQYLEADELKGVGEHFITIAHAQAWILVASYEARCMHFTRAAMSAARALKLCHMMGLHRIDEPGHLNKMTPTIMPPQDWIELEERRRTFWGAFNIDSHGSVSTGWPSMISPVMISTNLPSSEEAFINGQPEETVKLKDIYTGAPYSNFAATVGICHVFNQILSHVTQDRPDDRPEDLGFGNFWKRHREIDNLLSSAFMFMPERLRTPNFRNPISVFTNLNLHAAVICLHQSAVDRADAHSLPESVKQASIVRLTNAAEEIVSTMRQCARAGCFSAFSNPLLALSLYCAVSVFVLLLTRKRDGQDGSGEPPPQLRASYIDNLNFVLETMAALGKVHNITRAFLRQCVVDIERHNLSSLVNIPSVDGIDMQRASNSIPLFARTYISKNIKMQPPLLDHLPLGKYVSKKTVIPVSWACAAQGVQLLQPQDTQETPDDGQDNDGNRSKRRRMSGQQQSPPLVPPPPPPPPPSTSFDGWHYNAAAAATGFPVAPNSELEQQPRQQNSIGDAGPLPTFPHNGLGLPRRESPSNTASSRSAISGSSGTPVAPVYAAISGAGDGGSMLEGTTPSLVGVGAAQASFLPEDIWDIVAADAFGHSVHSLGQNAQVGTTQQDLSWTFLADV